MAIIIHKGQTFTNRETVTNTKLHNLVDFATWTDTLSTAGDMAYFNGSDWIRIPKGNSGEVLTMNATATAPEWKTPVNLYEDSDKTLTLSLKAPSVTIT
jgi:hypothetical protein